MCISKNVTNHLAAYGVRVHEDAVAPEERRGLLGLPDPPLGAVAGPVHEPPVEEGREGQQKQHDLHEHYAEREDLSSFRVCLSKWLVGRFFSPVLRNRCNHEFMEHRCMKCIWSG